MAARVEEILAEDWVRALKERLLPPWVLVGIGNRLRGDDGIGPAIVDQLQEAGVSSCFDGGAAPENLLDLICRLVPRTVLLIDAVDSGAPPGSIRLFAGEELVEVDVGTHLISPRLLSSYLQNCTGAEVFLLGIQPQQCNLGEEMSRPCQEASEAIAQALAALSTQVG